MDTALQRKPFFRPPSQFEEWRISQFVQGFVFSALVCILRNLTVYYPNLVQSDNSVSTGPFVDSIISAVVSLVFVGVSHARCKYTMHSHTKLHVFGLYLCSVLGWAIPTLLFSFGLPEKLFEATMYHLLTYNLVWLFCGGLYTLIFVEAK